MYSNEVIMPATMHSNSPKKYQHTYMTIWDWLLTIFSLVNHYKVFKLCLKTLITILKKYF